MTDTQNAKTSKKRRVSRKTVRLRIAIAGLALLGVSVALMLFAFRDNVVFFFGPSEVVEKGVEQGRTFRLGGLVKEGSVDKTEGGKTVHFIVTDLKNDVPVVYTGILPDLFREGQGVVTLGSIGPGGVFKAREVLAKHDEKYMPPEAVEAMKRAGTWEGDAAESGSSASEQVKSGG